MYGFRFKLIYFNLAALCLSICACSAPPQFLAESEFSVIRANSMELAVATNLLVDQKISSIRSLIPNSLNSKPEIWIALNRNLSGSIDGYNERVAIGPLMLRNRIYLRPGFSTLSLCHELTHHQLPIESSSMPLWLHEGICEWVAFRACAEKDAKFRQERFVRNLAKITGLSISLSEGEHGLSLEEISFGQSTTLQKLFKNKVWNHKNNEILLYSLSWLLLEHVSQTNIESAMEIGKNSDHPYLELAELAGWDESTGADALELVFDFQKNHILITNILESVAEYLIKKMRSSSADSDAMQILNTALTLDLWIAAPWGQKIELRSTPKWEAALREKLDI